MTCKREVNLVSTRSTISTCRTFLKNDNIGGFQRHMRVSAYVTHTLLPN